MAYIDLVPDDEAQGKLKEHYDAAIARAGRVFEIVRTMSPNPAVLEASMAFYAKVMKGPSGVSRKERELLAVVTSAAKRLLLLNAGPRGGLSPGRRRRRDEPAHFRGLAHSGADCARAGVVHLLRETHADAREDDRRRISRRSARTD